MDGEDKPGKEVDLKDESSLEFVVSAESPGEDDDPLIGKVIARKYELRSVLGRGGMSTVYRAHNLALDSSVAVKILHRHLWTRTQAKDRFRVEAKALNDLSHENLVSFKDYGVTDDGEPYMVMEFLEGESLDEHIRENGSLPVAEVISLLKQVAAGLSAAHARGIVHRDIKPSNVLLLDSGKKIKLLDFGIAKIVSGDYQKDGGKLTQTGDVFGSPLYMSPEQCLGKNVDQRSDIYSLGCLLFEMITTRPPFTGSSALEIFNKQISERPLSIKDFFKVDVSVLPPGLDRLVLKHLEDDDSDLLSGLDHMALRCLEKEPSNRYQNLEEFLMNLKSLEEGSLVVPSLSTSEAILPEERSLEEIKANIPLRPAYKKNSLSDLFFELFKGFFALAAVLFVLCFATLLLGRLLKGPSATSDKTVKKPAVTVPRDAGQDAKNFDDIAYSYYKAGEYEKAIPLLKFGVETYKEKKTNNPSYLADNMKHLGDCYRNLNKNGEALKWYEKAYNLYRDNNINNAYSKACKKEYAQALVKAGRTLEVEDLLGPDSTF